jgi:hypothetical protein
LYCFPPVLITAYMALFYPEFKRLLTGISY